MKTITRFIAIASLLSLTAACGDGDSDVTVVQVESGVWAEIQPGETLRVEGDVRTSRDGNRLLVWPERGNDGVALLKVPYFVKEIRTRGNAEVVMAPMRLDLLELDAAGTSTIQVSGVTAEMVVRMRGDAEIDASQMTAIHAEIDGSGNAEASIYVTSSVSGHLSGNSELFLFGDGSVDATGLTADDDATFTAQ